MSDQQAQRVQDLLTGAGVTVEYRSFPDVGHSMHGERPELYVETLLDWVGQPRRCEHVRRDRRARPLPAGGLPGGAARQRSRATRRIPPDPGLVRRGAPGGDGSARHRDAPSCRSPHPACTSATQSATRDLAREVNEDGRRAVVDHPGRFGLFASLPLPDVDAAIAEIAYCCDRLDVAGFALLTNIGGTYLGDQAFEPVFRELDRRGARLFIHPTSPACWEHTSLGRPRPMLEFFFDTTRAVVDLVLNGTVAHHPEIEFLIPHAGATLPMVADRVSVFSLLLAVDPAVDVLRDLGRLHFDLAGFPLPRQLDALLTLTTLEHLHYGSDYPFTPEFVAAMAA